MEKNEDHRRDRLLCISELRWNILIKTLSIGATEEELNTQKDLNEQNLLLFSVNLNVIFLLC